MQNTVDQFIELYMVSKQLEERMKPLREAILAFLKEQNLEYIENRKRTGKVQLTVAERPTMTSRYSVYDIEELSRLLDVSMMQRCMVQVVDKDKLEALCKLGEIESEVLKHKSTKQTYSLTVRYDK
jgi:hypothetical protein